MKVVAFGASNSRSSINKQLASYAASLLEGVETEVLDLNDYDMPIYSADREQNEGVPVLAQRFVDKITEADALIISYAEHNGTYTAAYKNIFDWASRIEKKLYKNKPLVILATSPGAGGAKNVLAQAVASAPHFGAELKAEMSIPSFNDNFDTETAKVSDPEIDKKLAEAVSKLQ